MSEVFYSASSTSSFQKPFTPSEFLNVVKKPRWKLRSNHLVGWIPDYLKIHLFSPWWDQSSSTNVPWDWVRFKRVRWLSLLVMYSGLSSDRVFEYYDFPLSPKTNIWFDFIFHFYSLSLVVAYSLAFASNIFSLIVHEHTKVLHLFSLHHRLATFDKKEKRKRHKSLVCVLKSVIINPCT